MLSRKLSIFLTSLTVLFATSASAAPAKILPLGDSITSDGGNSAYRNELFDKLTTAGYDFEFVGSLTDNDLEGIPPVPTSTNGTKHEGHSGWEANDILNHQPDNLNTWITNYDIDVALIHLGTNDIINRLPNAQLTDITPTTNAAQTRTELESIFDTIKNKNINTDIFVAKILPLGTIKDANGNYTPTPPNLANDYSAPFNSLLTPVWATAENITIVDQNTGFTASDMRSLLIHPNASGEEKMAQRWFGKLVAKPIIPPKITAISTHSMVGTFPIAVNSKSNGAITSYSSSSHNTCTIKPTGVITPVNVGECIIMVSQAEGKNDALSTKYAATSSSVTIDITLQAQTITFGGDTRTPKTYKKIPSQFTVTASSNSGLTVSIEAITPTVCTIDTITKKVTIISAGIPTGICKFKATQAGDNKYAPAEKTHQIIIERAAQTITFDPLPDVQIGSGDITLTATTTAEKPNDIIFSTESSACSISGSGTTVKLVATGECKIKARQVGNDKYKPAEKVIPAFTITEKTPQTITFPPISDKPFGTPPFILNAKASPAEFKVSYISTTTDVCKIIEGNKVTLLKVGHCKIIASAGSSTVPSVTASREFDVIPNAEQNTYDTVIKILNGNGNAATTKKQLELIGLKKLNPNFDYTQALKKGSYKNKSKDEVIKEMQRIIDNENSGNLETAGSSSAAWLLLLGVIALYRRNRFVRNIMNHRNN